MGAVAVVSELEPPPPPATLPGAWIQESPTPRRRWIAMPTFFSAIRPAR